MVPHLRTPLVPRQRAEAVTDALPLGAAACDHAGVTSSSVAEGPVRDGAEAVSLPGGPTGVLLCHGFTGSPASLRPWAEALAQAGHRVELPRLPGHGTRWQDLSPKRWDDWYGTVASALEQLSKECDQVFVMGLSMGGTLTLALAQEHPQQISGIVLVNPSVMTRNKALVALPVMRRVLPSLPGIVNDIKKPGQDELGYSRMPLNALDSLAKAWPVVRERLPTITLPVLLLHSTVDHVVEPENSQFVLDHIGSSDVTVVDLTDSFHVATLDNDQPVIIRESLDFISRLTTAKPNDGA